jgi:hypothetical protein
MSFEKIEFVKPNDILQGGFNPSLPAEITVTEQLLYSIANNLAILNNNLINSGALQNLALLGDLMQEVFTDNVRVQNKQTSVFKTADSATNWKNQSVFVASPFNVTADIPVVDIGIAQAQNYDRIYNQLFWQNKPTTAVVNQAASTYSFNVPVPSVSVSSSPATVNVSATAPVVNNNVPVPEVNNVVNVASAVPDITVNATAPVVNNNIPVPSVTNQIDVQSATPTIEVSSTAPVVNVSSSPATVNVSSTAPVVNNNVPVPSVNVQSAVAPINVSPTAPVVNVSSSPANIDIQPYDDTALIAKFEQIKEVLETSFIKDDKSIIEQALNVNTDDTKMSISEVLLSKDNITFNDVNVESLLDKDFEIKEFLK